VSACSPVDSFPDVSKLGDDELKDFLDRLEAEERDLFTRELATTSYKRRILHGKIDIVRAEFVNRRRRRRGDGEDPDGSGGTGTREPRRPGPQSGGGSISLPAAKAGDEDRTS
jgi:hypothetical protein